jgi:hypothetical protein
MKGLDPSRFGWFIGPVQLAYNPYFLTCVFSRNSVSAQANGATVNLTRLGCSYLWAHLFFMGSICHPPIFSLFFVKIDCLHPSCPPRCPRPPRPSLRPSSLDCVSSPELFLSLSLPDCLAPLSSHVLESSPHIVDTRPPVRKYDDIWYILVCIFLGDELTLDYTEYFGWDFFVSTCLPTKYHEKWVHRRETGDVWGHMVCFSFFSLLH